MNIDNRMYKMLDLATRKPEKFTRFQSDDEGHYFMLRAQTKIPVIRLIVTIFCKNAKIYNFDTSNEKQRQIAVIFKRDKELAIIDTEKNSFYFGGYDEGEDEAKFTAVVRIIFDGDIHLLIADSHSESLDMYSTDNEVDGDATEALFGILTNIKANAINEPKEVQPIEDFSFC